MRRNQTTILSWKARCDTKRLFSKSKLQSCEKTLLTCLTNQLTTIEQPEQRKTKTPDRKRTSSINDRYSHVNNDKINVTADDGKQTKRERDLSFDNIFKKKVDNGKKLERLLAKTASLKKKELSKGRSWLKGSSSSKLLAKVKAPIIASLPKSKGKSIKLMVK